MGRVDRMTFISFELHCMTLSITTVEDWLGRISGKWPG